MEAGKIQTPLEITNGLFENQEVFSQNDEFVEATFQGKTTRIAKNQLILNCISNLTNEQSIAIKAEIEKLNCKIVGQIPRFNTVQIEIPEGTTYDEISIQLSNISGVKNVLPNIAISPSSVIYHQIIQ